MVKHDSLISILVVSIGLAACHQTTRIGEAELPSKIDFSDGFQQSDADAILRDCEAEDINLRVDQTGAVTLESSLNADYDASVCVIEHVRKSGTTKFGFVGNDKYVTPDEGQ